MGLLLHGPPGTGKTALARAVAADFHTVFIAVDLSAIVGAHIGESERLFASVFCEARNAAPAVVFVDELDALFSGHGRVQAGALQTRLTATLAAELDQCSDELSEQLMLASSKSAKIFSGVNVIAATNVVMRIDPCLRAVGRLESALSVGYPDWSARRSIAAQIICNGLVYFVDDGVTADTIANLTSFRTGADIEAIMRYALSRAMISAGPNRSNRFEPVVTLDILRNAVVLYRHEYKS